MSEELKLLEKCEDYDYAKYIYEYRGYIIKKSYFAEDDCTHESSNVYLGDKKLAEFHWSGSLKEAIAFIEERICQNKD